MLLHDIGHVLNGVARLFVGAGLLQDMRRDNDPQVMGIMRQQVAVVPIFVRWFGSGTVAAVLTALTPFIFPIVVNLTSSGFAIG